MQDSSTFLNCFLSCGEKKINHCAMHVIRLWIRSNYILQVFSLKFREKPSQSL